MRTIRVTGKGQIKVHPDMTRITMTLEGIYPEYADTLRRSSEDTEQLWDTLEPFVFERTALKTLRFDIDTEFESYKEHDSWEDKYSMTFSIEPICIYKNKPLFFQRFADRLK